MAIDTANKRFNFMRFGIKLLPLGLVPTAGIDADDREHGSRMYIGFSYSAATSRPTRQSKIRINVRVGF